MKVMIMSKSGSKGRRAQIDLTRPSPAFKHTRVMTRLERSGAFFPSRCLSSWSSAASWAGWPDAKKLDAIPTRPRAAVSEGVTFTTHK